MTWRRSDLTAHGLGTALVHDIPHYALSYWPAYGFTITGPDGPGLTATGIDLRAVRVILAATGTEEPTADDLDWLTGRETDDLPWSDPA